MVFVRCAGRWDSIVGENRQSVHDRTAVPLLLREVCRPSGNYPRQQSQLRAVVLEKRGFGKERIAMDPSPSIQATSNYPSPIDMYFPAAAQEKLTESPASHLADTRQRPPATPPPSRHTLAHPTAGSPAATPHDKAPSHTDAVWRVRQKEPERVAPDVRRMRRSPRTVDRCPRNCCRGAERCARSRRGY
jgi:hypothetical protein